MNTSEQILASLQSPDWQERIRAMNALADFNDPKLIPQLVSAFADSANITDGMVDTEAIIEATRGAIFAMNESARIPLEHVRDSAPQTGHIRDAAVYLLEELDEWQWLIKHNPGMY